MLLQSKHRELITFYRDELLPVDTEADVSLEPYPGVGSFSFQPLIKRQPAGTGAAKTDDADLLFLVGDAAALVQQGLADTVFSSPFACTEEDGGHWRPPLQDVLDTVRQMCQG